ncbi:MAG: D-2-hydroxyacid dehydrogenase [Gemmatimonadetes bacterium]|nr:D-2-hydroxyacid dehydrogenase [Gemmatimonadota bacterium]
MNVLIRMNLIEPLVEEIRQVDEKVRVIRVDSEEEALAVMPEIEVVCGEITRALFARRRKLAWIQSWGAGVDGLLYPELVESDVVLCSAKGYVGVHLADHAMALLLALTRGIHTAIRNPSWDPRWSIRDASWELVDRTMGIVGLGGTGRELARRAVAFGMRVVAVDPEDVEVPDEVEACWGMDRFHALLEQSDVVAVCAPLTAETEGLFDREAFARMPEHALLINVTRGRIVDEAALLEALEGKGIGGAGLDVVPQEPLPGDHPLWKMDNLVITPHTAGGSPNRDGRCVALFCENLRRYLDGRPLTSVIDKRKGY